MLGGRELTMVLLPGPLFVFRSLRLPGKRLVCVGPLRALALLAARLASCCRSRSASQISRHVSIESYINLRAK